MVHFQTRDHLMGWLERHCPRPAIVRALLHGSTELLGGFDRIPPSGRPGWIVRVRSQFGKVWLVAIVPNRTQTDYEIRIPKEVPWKHWCGGPIPNPIYKGDRPWLYETIKERAMR